MQKLSGWIWTLIEEDIVIRKFKIYLDKYKLIRNW